MNDKHRTIEYPQFAKIENLSSWVNKNRASRHDTRKYPSKVIDFDLTKMRSIKPYHIGPLACMIHEYKEKGYKVRLQNLSERVNKYLSSFNFMHFCVGNNEVNNWPTPVFHTTLPLWRIVEDAATIYHIKVQEYFENNLLDDKELSPLSNSLGELMNNIFDHSESRIPGFTFTQLDTTRKEIITSVCDFGVTIPKKVNSYLEKIGQSKLSPIKAIEQALVNQFSTKSTPRNKGFGLHTTLSAVKHVEGKMLIVSGSAIFWQMKDGSHLYHLMEYAFPGTLIVIYLNVGKLQKKELELSDELHLM